MERAIPGLSSLNPGGLSHVYHSDQTSRAALMPALSLARGKAQFRYGWIQVLGQCRRAILHLSALLFPMLLCVVPSWPPSAPPYILSPCYRTSLAPLNQSPSHSESAVSSAQIGWVCPRLQPPMDSVPHEHLDWGWGGRGFPKRKSVCFCPKTGECMWDRWKQQPPPQDLCSCYSNYVCKSPGLL